MADIGEVVGLEAPKFIGKARIVESLSSQRIPIPDDGRYFRTQGGEVKFFENKIETRKNGFVHIPQGTVYVSFPYFRNRGGHMVYGEPHFYYG